MAGNLSRLGPAAGHTKRGADQPRPALCLTLKSGPSKTRHGVASLQLAMLLPPPLLRLLFGVGMLGFQELGEPGHGQPAVLVLGPFLAGHDA